MKMTPEKLQGCLEIILMTHVNNRRTEEAGKVYSVMQFLPSSPIMAVLTAEQLKLDGIFSKRIREAYDLGSVAL